MELICSFDDKDIISSFLHKFQLQLMWSKPPLAATIIFSLLVLKDNFLTPRLRSQLLLIHKIFYQTFRIFRFLQ